MEVLWQHALLVVAAAGVAGTGWRVASLAAPSGAPRLLAAATLGVAAIVAETLLLGLLGLSDVSVLLALLAVAVWVAVTVLTPTPASLRTLATEWWHGLGPVQQPVLAGLAAVLAGWIAWQLNHPNVGFDGEIYHLPIAADWAQTGSAGSVVDAVDGLPVGNYPLTNEVAVSWGLSLSRSWVWVSVWTPLVFALLCIAGWTGLRRLGAGRGITGLAIVAYAMSPFMVTQLGGPLTDVPCSAWLVVAATLCLCSREQPLLLAVALVAAGLSFGTKTTGAVLLALCFGAALWFHRRRLRSLLAPLAGALVLAIVVGGVWTLRNLIDHGSPLWPFVSGPFGDPLPPGLKGYEDAFLDHPGTMLDGRTSLYAQFLSGGLVLFAGALVAPALARTRAVLAAAGVTLLALLVWGKAPFTGIDSDTKLAVGAIRYLLPALAVATTALVLAARDGGVVVRRIVGTALGFAAFLSMNESFGTIGFPNVPSGATVTLLFVTGAVAALVVARLPRVVRALIPAVAVAGVVVGLAQASDGYVQRQTEAGGIDAFVLNAALADRRWRDGDFPIAMAPLTAALLRGDHLDHDVTLVPARACKKIIGDAIDARAEWFVLVTATASAEAAKVRRCFGRVVPQQRETNFTIYDFRPTLHATHPEITVIK